MLWCFETHQFIRTECVFDILKSLVNCVVLGLTH